MDDYTMNNANSTMNDYTNKAKNSYRMLDAYKRIAAGTLLAGALALSGCRGNRNYNATPEGGIDTQATVADVKKSLRDNQTDNQKDKREGLVSIVEGTIEDWGASTRRNHPAALVSSGHSIQTFRIATKDGSKAYRWVAPEMYPTGYARGEKVRVSLNGDEVLNVERVEKKE